MATAPLTSLAAGRGPGAVGVLVEVAVVTLALGANQLARWLTLDDLDVAVTNAHSLLRLEEALHLDWEHAAQDAVEATAWLGTVASWFYVWGYLPVVAGALVVLFVRRPRGYAFLRNALLAGGIAGLPTYVLYPLAPPRLTDLGYTDTVQATLVQDAARPAGIANEIAAMPSFHVGYLVIVSVVLWRVCRSRWLRAWCVAHPLVMCWVVLTTGNHWVLDLPAGLAVAFVGLAVARWVERRAAGPGLSSGRARSAPRAPARARSRQGYARRGAARGPAGRGRRARAAPARAAAWCPTAAP